MGETPAIFKSKSILFFRRVQTFYYIFNGPNNVPKFFSSDLTFCLLLCGAFRPGLKSKAVCNGLKDASNFLLTVQYHWPCLCFPGLKNVSNFAMSSVYSHKYFPRFQFPSSAFRKHRVCFLAVFHHSATARAMCWKYFWRNSMGLTTGPTEEGFGYVNKPGHGAAWAANSARTSNRASLSQPGSGAADDWDSLLGPLVWAIETEAVRAGCIWLTLKNPG